MAEGIKIDKNGCLELKRNGYWKVQRCPYCPGATFCGNHCPHFGDPDVRKLITRLTICQDKVLICKTEDFVDERPNQGENHDD